ALDHTLEQRNKTYQEAWDSGGGFAFMLSTYGDLIVEEEANNTATEFIRSKIRDIVKDADLAEKLCPSDFYAKRPLCVDNYYETFNRKNVTLCDVKNNPIAEFVSDGI